MTRWARTKSAHRHEKVPSNATPWSKLKPTQEVRSFKDGSKTIRPKPNNVEGNEGGRPSGVKRKMPEFQGTNFARQMTEDRAKNPFANGGGSSDVRGGPTQQNSKSQKRNKFKKNINREVSVKPSLKIEPKGVKQDLSQKRKKFQKTVNREVPFRSKEENSNATNFSVRIEPKEMTNSQQDLSVKTKRKRKRFKKGKLTIENQEIHKTEGRKYLKEEKSPKKSLLLVKQEVTELSKGMGKSAKKRKTDLSQTKNMDTPNAPNVVGLKLNKPEQGASTRPKKRKRNRKKKQESSVQSTGATDSSKNSDSAIESELLDQETSDQKKIDKEQKKTMHRLKLLGERKKKGITMLSEKAEKKLRLIRKALKKRGKSPEEIKSILRKERRIAELKFRKAQKTVCFRCRKEGHTVATCTTILEDNEQSMGVCYRCGSTEHILRLCPASKTDGLPYAKCFICESRGHLSSACPKNKLGIYPRGGACLLCKSVNHLKKDCPTLAKEEEEDHPAVAYRATAFGSADAEISDEVKVSAKKKAKVVTF